MTLHTIELSLDADGINAEFVCEGDKSSDCHQVCGWGCDIWDLECLTNHPRESIDYCNPTEYVTNGGDWYENYVGEETEPRSGPIVFEWQGEWYGWRYDANEQLNTAAENTTMEAEQQ